LALLHQHYPQRKTPPQGGVFRYDSNI